MHILSPVTDNCPSWKSGRRNESMLPDRVSNPGPLTYESGALPIALRGPARPAFSTCQWFVNIIIIICSFFFRMATNFVRNSHNYNYSYTPDTPRQQTRLSTTNADEINRRGYGVNTCQGTTCHGSNWQKESPSLKKGLKIRNTNPCECLNPVGPRSWNYFELTFNQRSWNITESTHGVEST